MRLAGVLALAMTTSAAHATPFDPRETLTLKQVTFSALPGWTSEKHAEAVPVFLRSCEKLAALADPDPVGHDGHGGTAKQWRAACAAAAKVRAGDDAGAKAMFEAQFVPWSTAGRAGPMGKLTGYFVQQLRASRTKHGKYIHPLYARPPDLVMVDLSKHIPDAKGRRIWGRLTPKGEVVPFPTRAEIRAGALANQGLELMYGDDAVDVLFAQIEGSARVLLDDGTTTRLEFAGKNGRAWRGPGGVLKLMGELVAPYNGTMHGIRAWFADHPTQFDEVADRNESFVFFKESTVDGAMGSSNVQLTPQRSLAIDRAFVAHGTPVWVQTRAPVKGKRGTVPWTRIVIAQDTGGGILGAVRGDIFWGDDEDAAELAGRSGGPGKLWLLLPRGVTQ